MKRMLLTLAAVLIAPAALAEMAPRDGWSVTRTGKTYDELVAATQAAIPEAGLIVVTQAGPTKAAAARGIEIPGNLVIGAYNNEFAVRVLELSTAAMIEAPIRFYVTENDDGTATLSYKLPSRVFGPYMDEAGAALAVIAAELDALFAEVAAGATR